MYTKFFEAIDEAAKLFQNFDKSKPIRIVSHLDADGISSASILVKVLNDEGRRYSLSIVHQLNQQLLSQYEVDPYEFYIFSDLASSLVSEIKEKLCSKGKQVLILDHHEIDKQDFKQDNLTIINPHLFEVPKKNEISGAGVVYYFSKAINPKNQNLAHIAIIGATGDIQEGKDGFFGLNKMILDEAIDAKKIKVISGLRVFGAQTRPLHKILEYSTDPYIPGVTGSESGSIQFLKEIGIDPRTEKSWKKLVHLNEEDMQKLVDGIILRRVNQDKPEDILGNVYLLEDEEEESPTKDVKEFSTLLNACGRMNNASLGIGACLNNPKIKQKAISSLSEYRREIVAALKWFEEKQNDSEFVTKTDKYLIVNTKEHVLPTIVGTMGSIIAKSKDLKDNTFVLSLGRLLDDTTKISLRVSGKRPSKEVDLRSIISESVKDIPNAESGGHQFAAGAVVPTEFESNFLKNVTLLLNNVSIEEKI